MNDKETKQDNQPTEKKGFASFLPLAPFLPFPLALLHVLPLALFRLLLVAPPFPFALPLPRYLGWDSANPRSPFPPQTLARVRFASAVAFGVLRLVLQGGTGKLAYRLPRGLPKVKCPAISPQTQSIARSTPKPIRGAERGMGA